MNATTKYEVELDKRFLITTKELQALLSCGYASAVRIGCQASAKVTIGRRVLWNREKIRRYVFDISEE